MMQVHQETRAGWCVVAVQGRADAAAADELELALCAAVEQNDKVAVDFGKLDYISSAGLRAILQAGRAAQTRGAEFAVCSATAPVQKVFDMCGLKQVLRIEDALPC